MARRGAQRGSEGADSCKSAQWETGCGSSIGGDEARATEEEDFLVCYGVIRWPCMDCAFPKLEESLSILLA